jgi:hypothetical protein
MQALWTAEEIEAIKNGAKHLPGRSNGAIRTMRQRLKVVVGVERPYTEAELQALRDGARSLPGRNYGAVFQKRKKMGLTKTRAPLWSPDEHRAVLDGAMSLPGRSYAAVMRRRADYQVCVNGRRTRPWTEAEIKLLDQKLPVPDRTKAEIDQATLARIGLTAKKPKGVSVRPVERRVDPYQEMLENIYKLIKRHGHHISRAEIASETMLIILEENLPLEVAVSEAMDRLKHFYRREKGHVGFYENYHSDTDSQGLSK